MPRKCPPGVFCIENVTIVFICVLFVIVALVFYYMNRRSGSGSGYDKNIIINTQPPFLPLRQKKGYGSDVFFDIYKAPLRDDRCFTGGGSDILRENPFMMSPYYSSGGGGGVPINIPTQECGDSNYRQVGILTRSSGNKHNDTILPLMGRPIFPRRDKWNFYTLNDKNNMIKLPVRVKGRSGTIEQGCDNVYSGDTIFVEGYNEPFVVTMYDNNTLRYLPNL
jgi:hypothetical protein